MSDKRVAGNAETMSMHDDANSAQAMGHTTRMECKVCWHVYDPAAGDDVWQIPPGTPWGELPPHWTCPQCSATRDGFLVLRDE